MIIYFQQWANVKNLKKDDSQYLFTLNIPKYQGVKEFHMLARIGCFKNYGFQSF